MILDMSSIQVKIFGFFLIFQIPLEHVCARASRRGCHGHTFHWLANTQTTLRSIGLGLVYFGVIAYTSE